jgi:apolipoprotein N-acyltransferase
LSSARESTALVNVTNDAWFGRSTARHQHLQISRMRAIESQRYVIRAANDGVSAIIGPRGELLAQAPDFKPVVLRGEVIPRFGVPPYLRFGNLPWLWLATLCGFVAIMMRRRERELPAAASV